jgi:hypothetical protein
MKLTHDDAVVLSFGEELSMPLASEREAMPTSTFGLLTE